MGIGGEYAAINSAIDELVPSAVRGTVDLIINATFWIGAAVGAGGTFLLLNSGLLTPTFSWRFAFWHRSVIGLGNPAASDIGPGKPALANAARKGKRGG